MKDLNKSSTSDGGARISSNRSINKVRSYFITIRKHQVKDFVGINDLMNILDYLMKRLTSLRLVNNSFEIDKKYAQLHFHAIIHVNEYFKYKSVSSYGGYRIFWVPVYDHVALIKYLYKDTQNNKYKQEIIIIDNYYTHKNAPNRFN